MAPDQVGTFKRVFEVEYEKVPIVLYRCSETGLRLALAQVQSPTVHGYFAIQTEAFDDYGCPHVLEHLTFLGSERYPYKGVLDLLANRCFAQGTNAWTDTDHTCYTVDTAGSEGFLRILPVYLDHVLFPTLKESGFLTEVHHVTGEGANAGVVYCEMQARENEAGDMIDRALKLATYPGRCSYKSETGGRLKELRELKNDTIREYHGAYYRPDNLCVIVTGQLDPTAFCKAVEPVVASIRGNDRLKSLAAMDRPFSSPIQRPETPRVERIEFPAEDEKTGAICEFAWHGPRWTELETITALDILLSYLTQDSISPLRKALVETQPPLCGKISFSMLEQSVYLLTLKLKSVDVEQLSKRDVDAEVTAVLRATVASMDVERIRSLLGQQRRQHLASVEEDPHELYSGNIIGAFLYAPDFAARGGEPSSGASLQARLNVPGLLDALMGWPAERWSTLLETWFLSETSCPRVTVIGTPSKACGERIQSEDAARVAAQKKELGEAGCKAAAAKVAEAEKENDVDTPDEVVRSFELPDASKISLVDVSTVTIDAASETAVAVLGAQAPSLKSHLEAALKAGKPAPSFHFNHVAGAQFVSCVALLPIDALTPRQLGLLQLWCDVAFELPMAASGLGPAMDYEAVVKALTDSTVSYGFNVGLDGSRFRCGSFAGNRICISVKVERSRYQEAVLWISRALADVQFDKERLAAAAKRMLNDVPNTKRNSQALMGMAIQAMNVKDDCAIGAFNAFRAEKLLGSLENDAALEAAATELASLRASLLGFAASKGGGLVRVAGDILALGNDPFDTWRKGPFVAGSAVAAPVTQPAVLREFIAQDVFRPEAGNTGGCLISSSAEESNYWTVQCDCFTDPRSPELAPLLVAIEYVTALEGPFWRQLRGKGLTYGYSISHSLEMGTIKFALFKSGEPVAAYQAASKIVAGLCNESAAEEEEKEAGTPPDEKKPRRDSGEGDEEEEGEDDEEDEGLNEAALEAAQSGVLFGLIEGVDTIPSAMGQVWGNSLSRVPPDQLQWLLKAVQEVTEEAVRAALRNHILPLFTGSRGRVVSLACPAQKRQQIEEGLRTLEPPIRATHFAVDDLVTALAPLDGFRGFRERLRA